MAPDPVACSLTPEERDREAAHLLPGLVVMAEAVEWLPEGMRLTFSSGRTPLPRIAAVMERERACCRFLAFHLEVPAGGGPVVLNVVGPEGTREVLDEVCSGVGRDPVPAARDVEPSSSGEP